MGARFAFWLKALFLGAEQAKEIVAWLAVVATVAGIAGYVVPVVFHLSYLVVIVVLLCVIVAAFAEGSFRVWHATDNDRIKAIDDLHRGGQARLVHVYKRIGLASAMDMPGENSPVSEGVHITVDNKSEQPIYDLTIYWKRGTSLWENSKQKSKDHLEGGEAMEGFEPFPGGVRSDDDKKLFSADVYFKDANQVSWCITSDRKLTQTESPQMGTV